MIFPNPARSLARRPKPRLSRTSPCPTWARSPGAKPARGG